jgi:hypothetical protein
VGAMCKGAASGCAGFDAVYMSKRRCSHWTVCEWSSVRVRDVSSRVFEMRLS